MEQTENRKSVLGILLLFFLSVAGIVFLLHSIAGYIDPVRRMINNREAEKRAQAVTTVVETFTLLVQFGAAITVGYSLVLLYAKGRKWIRESDLVYAKENLMPARYANAQIVNDLNPREASVGAALFGKMPAKLAELYAKQQERQDARDAALLPEIVFPDKIPIYNVPKPLEPALPIGRDTAGRDIYLPLEGQSPLLISGVPNSGKTEGQAAMIAAVGSWYPDGKTIELDVLDAKGADLRRVKITPFMPREVVYKPDDCVTKLQVLVARLDARVEMWNDYKVVSLSQLREQGIVEPYIVPIIDEASRLTNHRSQALRDEATDLLQRLAEQGRAFGIVPVFSTQLPRAQAMGREVTGQCFARLCFKMATPVDSRTVLFTEGAENLENPGEFLYRYSGIVRGKGYFAGIRDGLFYPFMDNLALPTVAVSQVEIPQLPAPRSEGEVITPQETQDQELPYDRKPKAGAESRMLFTDWLYSAKKSTRKKPSIKYVQKLRYPKSFGSSGGGEKWTWIKEVIERELAKRGMTYDGYMARYGKLADLED